MADLTPVLSVRDLSFRYPDGTHVLDRVNLDIAAGERVALLGPNGAGKTTLLLHLIGVLGGADGSISVAGLPLDPDNVMEIRRQIGLVFQDPDDQLFMPTVAEDVAFGPANYGTTGEELGRRVGWALDQVGMAAAADRAPHHLSGGERRRVSVATVLAMGPRILILDEPTSNLDPAGRRELAAVIDGLDVTLLLVTHDLPFALGVCRRAVIMDGGRVVADGPTAEVMADTELMRAHRLELPLGFDPARIRPPSP